jgi:CRISPR-associated protein Csb1
MSEELRSLDVQTLRAAIEGDAAAFRCITELQPAGGVGDKVFPPTYEGGEYALETRVIDGQRVPCVLLDSVQSQANRLELALLEGHRAGKLRFPLVQIDFSQAPEEEVRAVGLVTALELPHRLADAHFGASEVEEDGKRKPFRHRDPKKVSSLGRRFAEASTANATPLFELCPTALLFGMWDSHKPHGTGKKYQRAIASEIVGFNTEPGRRPASRIDPIIRTAKDIPVELSADGWRVIEKGGMKLSKVGLGNVTPSLKDEETGRYHYGGVTMQSARQTCVLSLAALRRLRFPVERGGKRREDERGNVAARMTLVALALAAVSRQWKEGFDLRSRCLLVPQHPLRIELLSTGPAQIFTLSPEGGADLLRDAAGAAVAAGLNWSETPLTLHPNKELVKAVQLSRQRETAEAVK